MKKKLYIIEDVSDQGTDFLRQMMGTYWVRVSGASLDPNVAFDYGYEQKRLLEVESSDSDIDIDMRGFETHRALIDSPDSKYKIFGKVEINPTRIYKINKKVSIPNFKIPVRIKADVDYVRSDKHWNMIFYGRHVR